MARKSRDPGLERAWRERVARWSTSGQSVRAFCRQHGLIETSFYYWKRELRAREAAVTAATGSAAPSHATASPAMAAAKSSASPPRQRSMRQRPVVKTSPSMFVPVTVLPDVRPCVTTLAVEVRCPSGHVVLLPACDVASLSSLLAALTLPEREPPSC
jgi:transposase-like protein